MTPVRVLVVDDHQLFREGVRALLDSLDGIEVVGEAANGSEALALAEGALPDVVLMDVQMPDMTGLEATRRLLAAHPNVGVVIVTMFDDDETVFAAMRAGARGYVLKGAGQADLARAIEAVARGEAIYGPGVAGRILQFFRASRTDLPVDAFPDLTDREREVLDQIAAGKGNAAIARRLGITEKTVKNHVSNIYSKLHVADRAQAMLRARDAGYGRTER
ncbi:MAG: DNA-binding response regulator [Trueperaceae bacterium]|nr:MAG: DNA-binding response regulator [Trueperaceae bacterium]